MPTLLLHKKKCLKNMEAMAARAQAHGLVFRPHCKTHQSATIASWFREFGVDRITVSSFTMALYFARHGWKDILVAFPFVPADLDLLDSLCRSVHMSVLIDNPACIPFFRRIGHAIDYYIDVDTGYGRTGIPAGDHESVEDILKAARAQHHLRFRGFYCHAGHSYKARDRKAIRALHGKAMADLQALRTAFGSLTTRVLYGDTPTCSTMDDFSAVDEITPGNFVFFDLTQHALGSCTMDQIAVAMACPVAGKYGESKLLVHGGAVHFSRDMLHLEGKEIFGQVVRPAVSGWGEAYEGSFLTSLSQEHGILDHCGPLHRHISIGDQLLILPVHSCLAANLMKGYQTIEGERIGTLHCAP